MTNIKDSFSVIIRARDEERWIGHAIQSVIDFIPNNEIIIVDNKSNDETINIASGFVRSAGYNDNDGNYTDICFAEIDDYSPGKSLNLGTQLAKYDNIAILSAHCIIKQLDLNALNSNLKKYAGIFGNQNPIYQGKRITKRYLWSHFSSNQTTDMFSEMERRYFFHNAISFFRKETLIKYPFNETITGKEDRYWAKEVIEAGESTFYDPEILADHHYTNNGNTWKGIG
jgi:glycosyltransferase involved in cell wall biosynthesis